MFQFWLLFEHHLIATMFAIYRHGSQSLFLVALLGEFLSNSDSNSAQQRTKAHCCALLRAIAHDCVNNAQQRATARNNAQQRATTRQQHTNSAQQRPTARQQRTIAR